MRAIFLLLGLCILVFNPYGRAQETNSDQTDLKQADKDGRWIRPAQGTPAQPVWGHVNGIRAGISPLPGPRGLLRIYTPYLGHKEDKVINFIALEPIVAGQDQRGFSELEMSTLDHVRGKRFWSSNDSLSTHPLPAEFPAHGVIEKIKGIEVLTVFIFSEPFDNGARVYIRLRFFEDRPCEMELTAYREEKSKELDYFILTATMGNFARLRSLYLTDSVKSSLELWPDYTGSNFTDHDVTPMEAMIKDKNGAAYFIAATNEDEPQHVTYEPGTKNHWRYYGEKATQYWRKENPEPQLEGLVNGRYTYWASKSPIPGGIAFENFEMKEPFKNGAKYVFGVSPLDPDAFIKKLKEE